MKVLAVANQKGGVGKTATAQALGVALAREHGRRVILVDCDPQASLTYACGVQEAAGRSLAEVLGGAQAGTLALGAILCDLGGGLWLAPGDIALAGVELGLVQRIGREAVLRRALGTLGGRYDLAILDCPPSLSLLTVNALAAADAVLIPTQAEIVALRGLRLFLDTLAQVRDALNPELATLGILPTFVDGRLVHHREALEMMRTGGLPLLDVTIGRSVRVAEAAGSGQTVLEYDAHNPRAAEYRALGEVVEKWLAGNRP